MLTAMLSIQMDKDCFDFPDNKGAKGMSGNVKMLDKLCATIPLGHFVALVPEHQEQGEFGGGGMTTLMKIITGQLYANSADVLVPPHLHTRLVHPEPLILAEPLLKNLLFGNPKCDPAFAWQVAEELGLSSKLLKQDKMHVGTGGFSLRLIDRQVVCLARALIADPHVIVCCKPAATFSQRHAGKVFSVLKDWQERKGLWLDAGTDGKTGRDQDPVLNTRTVIFGVPAASSIPPQVDVVATLCHRESGAVVCLEPRNSSGFGREVVVTPL
jgi:hypothetical protein